jgi:hypothetical protein
MPTDVAGAVIGRRDDVLDREDRLQELEEPCDAHAGSRAREIWGWEHWVVPEGGGRKEAF